ncbi:2Fe-2S iron-sulfur cluster-binding protein [Sinisalibacter aestuarii]|uniref:Ferredoxin n=1 Tax=Sinisalibacter aestuarii TaxID=2949426 RepID=A0ABQ5LYA4_9RHOB|nr:2Fe-2S iron-sulfur cluster-binding protein [Sinisalibacter aestuarii]GKY89954.1 ferredoxin [Sinisalibacter aestuarii]
MGIVKVNTMVTFHLETRDGTRREITGAAGISAMEAIRASGCDEIAATCGGSCSCATCHVYLRKAAPEFLPPISPTEEDLLDFAEDRTEQSRLSCQVILRPELDGMEITVAPASAF